MDCNKFPVKSPGSKIPTYLSPIKKSSVRILGHKENLSSSLPSSALGELGQYMRPNPLKADYEPLSLNKKKMNTSSRICYDDDLESVGSVISNFSVATTNSICEHANFAKNGTTYSGRSQKYIVHCSSYWNGEEYLTPTQRANRNIRKLKSLLQLAREKLREKEDEIFKLNKEVVELKSGTKVLNSPVLNAEFSEKVQNFSSLTSEKFSEESPIKHLVEPTYYSKSSPIESQDNLGDKSMTPDFLFSSMADSGNFDDLTSSASVYSKDSCSFVAASGSKSLQPENMFITVDSPNENDKTRLIKMYEKKLEDKKMEYEAELKKVIDSQEEKNIRMICEFENKLKEEEMKFESRWNDLLKSAEEEKVEIIKRFEEKLEEEKEKYRENLMKYKVKNDLISEMDFEKTYSKNVADEKNLYETSLMCMKQRFEAEKSLIEKKFDESVIEERHKFENNLKKIKHESDLRVSELALRVSELESEYSKLLPKYESALSQSEDLEKENKSLRLKLQEQEENYKKMFLTIYKKGQEAARLDLVCQDTGESNINEKKLSVPELFAELKITEVELENLKAMYKRLVEAQQKHLRRDQGRSDPEATLQFLKSAVYYFLTDRENHLGHLKAIESILGFSSAEKSNIENLYFSKYY